ncbi:hypothetical protein WR25_09976 [Diploscapter pachys]|uniref:PH domain-containing protein n=1 Tax=Diploscapter pachys TaxID=2018661 RepID=A0A2A2KQU9_9BILA|nr:hypothetical protein WR25_09976 [Diploscapter pachys]
MHLPSLLCRSVQFHLPLSLHPHYSFVRFQLEDQNERLRLQNLRVTNQLQMLRSFTEKSQQLKAEMAMSRSVTGSLPLGRDSDNRTSDDSGLTSDETSSEAKRRGSGQNEKGTGMILNGMSNSCNESTPRIQRKGGRSKKESEDKRSSTSDSSPYEEKSKPIPVPRKVTNTINNNNQLLERDSLNSYADEYEFDVEDEIFDEVEASNCHGSSSKYTADYVNLAEFVSIRDDNNLYSDIIKPIDYANAAPPPPDHKPRQWETRLFSTAEKCLSLAENFEDEASHSGAPSPYRIARLSNTRTDSISSARPQSGSCSSSSRFPHRTACSSPLDTGGHYAVRELACGSADSAEPSGCIYAAAAAAASDIRTSLVPSCESMEKSGYWTQMSDSRLKSLKRRFVILKNGQLSFYRTMKNHTREEDPLMKWSIADIKTVTKIHQQGAAYAFQIVTPAAKMNFMTDSEKTTHEWVTLLSAAIKGATLREMANRIAPIDASISGWMSRVRCGHSKRLFAALVNSKLMFFRHQDDIVPHCFLHIQGARVSDKQDVEEYSGSSDEQLDGSMHIPNGKRSLHSICIQIANEDPVYLVLRTAEEKEKWLFYLKTASDDAAMKGTPFEILINRMMAEDAHSDSPLWKDILLTAVDESPTEPLTSMAEKDKKKAMEIVKACYLFVSVLMRPQGAQYHIDLAQNILSTSIQHDFLKNELYAQLIRLTNGSMPFGLQGWKLLALSLPLFVPKQYALLWLLKRHVSRWAEMSGDEANMAGYCEAALGRSLRVSGRLEGPSRLEATSVLTRDVTATKFPHSISVRLPNDEYQVVEFDGSTEVGQCLSSLCLKLGLRPALLSGYALYIENPATKSLVLLKGKQKICDTLAAWEYQQRDTQRGRIHTDCAPLLSLHMRHYWRHLTALETPIERSFLVWRMADELVAGRMPISSQLADSLAALFAQMSFGDAGSQLEEDQFAFVTNRCFPAKMLQVTCIKSLRDSIHSNWLQLQGMTENEARRVVLQVLRKWPFFGCSLHEAGMRTSNDKKVFLALSDTAVHILDHRHFVSKLLSYKFRKLYYSFTLETNILKISMMRIVLIRKESYFHFNIIHKDQAFDAILTRVLVRIFETYSKCLQDLIRTCPYSRLSSFGEFHSDFMLTIDRPLSDERHPEETPKERITFSMPKQEIDQITLHLAEYIRCQKLVWKVSK